MCNYQRAFFICILLKVLLSVKAADLLPESVSKGILSCCCTIICLLGCLQFLSKEFSRSKSFNCLSCLFDSMYIYLIWLFY